MNTIRGKNSGARERILKTAERLFYAEGVRAVGIDRIIAEAGVAKMSLYNHFASKDDLILAVLQTREAQVEQMFAERIAVHLKKRKNRLEAFFGALKDWFQTQGFRGCSFINASVELADFNHPASQFSTQHKVKFQEMIHDIITQTDGPQVAATVTPAIALLVEGAIITALMNQNAHAADIAKSAALALVSQAKDAS